MLSSGDSISRYRIAGPLGRGGMGVVYRAEDTRLQRPVALKFVPPESLSPLDRQRLLNEAVSAARIRHPNVCPIYDVEEASGQLFISMALLEGETLARKIDAGPIDPASAVRIALQVAAGLEAAHILGILHRDIKPSNIMVAPDGHVSILDFGLATHPESQRLTAVDRIPGTPAYMAPEQLRGQPPDARADIWALGVVLFEMLAGRRPFQVPNQALAHCILSTDAPLLSTVNPGIPARLVNTVARALARDPNARWPSAAALAAELKEIAQTFEVEKAVQSGLIPAYPPQRPRRSHRTIAVAAAALALAAGAIYAWRGRQPAADQQSAAPASARDAKQVAVLPFQIASANDRTRTIADGLTEVLTESIADAGGPSKLIAVPSREIRRREISTVADARRIYAVDYVLTGSVTTEASGELRFSLRLIDAATSKDLGSAAFAYNPAHAKNARDLAVSESLKLLRLKSSAKPASGESENAYSAYLEGRGYLSRFDVPGNPARAIAAFRRALDTDPRFVLAWVGLSEAALQKLLLVADKETADMALDSAQQAVRLDPANSGAQAILGAIYGRLGRQADAISHLQSAAKLSPVSAEPHRELARMYAATGRFDEAEAAYKIAIARRPTDWYGLMLLGRFYLERENYAASAKTLKDSLKLAPSNEIVLRLLGAVDMFQGRYDDALHWLQLSAKSRPVSNTYINIAGCYYYLHKYREAAAAGETAIDLDPQYHNAWGNLAIYYRWIPGSEARSAEALKRAIDLTQQQLAVAPNAHDLRAAAAEYRARQGDKRGALQEIARIPDHARQSGIVSMRLATALEIMGDRKGAIQLLSTSVSNPATLNQIRDDPEFAGLWTDPDFQAAVAAKAKPRAPDSATRP